MNIVLFCTYPIKNPNHGGELRVRNIVDNYIAKGHKVEVVGVLGSAAYEKEDGFASFPEESELRSVLDNTFLMEDYVLGILFEKNTKFFNILASKISIKPDLIHVEQPWLFGAAYQILKEKFPSAKIIYGSQNVENKLKREILSTYFDYKIVNQYTNLIEAIELNAIKHADAVICVSKKDAEWVKQYTNKTIIMASNGVKAWQSSEADHSQAIAITKKYSFALYCASAHPPNMTGFFEMLKGGFGSLKPDEKLVIAGGAGLAIADDPRLLLSAKLAEKIIVAGLVSQPCLNSLLDLAHCIILPLTQGGGTNLKTAEALWARKHIVTTSVAMRGFETFAHGKGIWLANEPKMFKQSIRNAMSSSPISLSDEEINERKEVLWEKTLASLLETIEKI